MSRTEEEVSPMLTEYGEDMLCCDKCHGIFEIVFDSPCGKFYVCKDCYKGEQAKLN